MTSPTLGPKNTAPPCSLATLLLKLQFSNVNVPSEYIDPPLPVTLPLINVIPFKVTVFPLAILNILDL